MAKNWAGGFDGKKLTLEEFKAHVAKLPAIPWVKGVTLHNTGVPDMARAADIGHGLYVRNAASYYRDKNRWSAGPHLFVGPDGLFLGTPLTARGVHSPSYNASMWGVEMMADFRSGKDDDDAGDGLRVKTLACKALAVLLDHQGLGAGDATVRLHREDKATTHACPGSDITKPDILARVRDHLAELEPAGEHGPVMHEPSAAPSAVTTTGVVNTDDLNMRRSAGATGALIKALAEGTKVTILRQAASRSQTWLYVSAAVAAPKMGWVNARYVTMGDGSSVASGPAAQPNALTVRDLFIRFGWPVVAARALTGRAQQESYVDIRLAAVGDGGKGYGMFQWHDPRQAAMRAWCKARGLPVTSYAGQVGFADQELRTSEKATGDALMRAVTIEEACEAVMGYVRPAGYSKGNPRAGHGFANTLKYARGLIPPARPFPAVAPDRPQLAVTSKPELEPAAVAIRDAILPATAPDSPLPTFESTPITTGSLDPAIPIKENPIMKKLFWPAIIALALSGWAYSAFAAEIVADDPNVVIPYGIYAQSIVGILTNIALAVVSAIIGYVSLQIPAILRPFVLNTRVKTLVQNAVRSAMAKVSGAVAGKQLTVPVASELLRHAIQYALTNASGGLLKWLGDSTPQLVDKLLAQMTEQGVVPPEFDLSAAIKAAHLAPKTKAQAKAAGDANYAGQGLRPAGL